VNKNYVEADVAAAWSMDTQIKLLRLEENDLEEVI
jgi:hypothetical protein